MKKTRLDVEVVVNGVRKIIGEIYVDEPEILTDLDKFSPDYVLSCFRYGHFVKERARFKSSKSGTSRNDKFAKSQGFDSFDEMVEWIKEKKNE